MKWPIILRSRHNTIVGALEVNLETRLDVIDALRVALKGKDKQIELLEATLKAQKCNDYTSAAPEKRKVVDPVFPTRSGWRTRAQIISDSTIPTPKDSAKALEDKVLKEGGTV